MYLYLRTSLKTKDRHLGLLSSLLQSLLVFYHSRVKEALSVFITTRGAKYLCVLCSYQEVSLSLGQPSDISNLVPPRLVLITLLSPTSSATS